MPKPCRSEFFWNCSKHQAHGDAVMKVKVTQDWCERMARLEGDAAVGVGLLACDPVSLLDRQIANGNRDATGRWLREVREDECGDCGLPITDIGDVCPHCGAA